MHYLLYLTLYVLLIFTSLNGKAQQNAFNGWLGLFNTYKVNEKIGISFDAQFRSNAQVKQFQTIILRPGINFNFNKNVFAALGYALVESRRTIGNVSALAPEHRIWEQLQASHPVGFTRLTHRFRLEQRFISRAVVQNNALHTSGNVFANRFRYFVRDIIPFSMSRKFVKGFYAALQNEVFINIGDQSHVNGKYFDQNRAYVSTGYRFSPMLDAETGYLNQYVEGAKNAFSNNHILQITAYIRL